MTPPRRRLDPADRAAAILEAASTAFRDHPAPAVSVAQIAEAAGISEALVFRYFGSRAGLHAAVVDRELGELRAAQAEALAALSPGAPARDHVRAAFSAHLDHAARFHVSPYVGRVGEPSEALAARAAACAETTAWLTGLLRPSELHPPTVRESYALEAVLGFLDAACARWLLTGGPDDERWPVIEASLGALEGALGDWGR